MRDDRQLVTATLQTLHIKASERTLEQEENQKNARRSWAKTHMRNLSIKII
jgi:hypothetical protein